jgi:hypothetical protein
VGLRLICCGVRLFCGEFTVRQQFLGGGFNSSWLFDSGAAAVLLTVFYGAFTVGLRGQCGG